RLVNNDSDTASTVRLTAAQLPRDGAVGTTKFFVADTAADRVFRYGRTGADNGSFVTDAAVPNARGIATNPTGDTLWILEGATQQVAVQGPDGTQRAAWQPLGLTNPQGIATNGTDLWIVDAG